MPAVHIVIDASDPERYRDAFRHVVRPVRLRLALVGALFVLLGVVEFALASGSWQLGVVLVAMGLAFGLLLPLRLVSASMRMLNPIAAGPTRFELTDRYVGSVSPLMSSQIAWAAYTRIDEIPGQILLRMGRRQITSVPTGGLTPEQLAELRAFVADRNFITGARGGGGPAGARRSGTMAG
jgi:hypothetical protein